MSRRKKAIDKQRKMNSPARKAKSAKKKYYTSSEASDKWEDKKGRKEQKYLSSKASKGVNKECTLMGWQKPNDENCSGCKLKCAYNYK